MSAPPLGAAAALDRLAAAQPALRDAAALLAALLAAGRALRPALAAGVPDEERARVRLAEGIPALAGEPLLSGEALLRDVRALADALRAAPGADVAGAPAAAALVADALERARAALDVDALAAAALAGGWEEVAALAPRLDVDEDALVTVLDHAVRPTLRAAAAPLRDAIARAPWMQGICPACGARPLLAELRASSPEGESERTLRCGRCASAWPFPRVACAACGTRDHRQLAYLHADGEDAYRRAQTCDACLAYLKELALLDPLDAELLLVEDLATVALDMVAVERGYRR
ncbi:MAG TPA: formate dehydrogenase accessory protein FdhE [Gemmatimonadaceae bacterium]|nr:formate dehydrogenase accessory protein FdhE [Gemmatimonadaceae bacterium]